MVSFGGINELDGIQQQAITKVGKLRLFTVALKHSLTLVVSMVREVLEAGDE